MADDGPPPVLGRNCEPLLRAILRPDPSTDAPWISLLSEWIKIHADHPSAGVLLQYGPHARTSLAPGGTASSGVSVFIIPAEILRENQLELLLVPGAKELNNEQAFKLPNGRMIDLPVHKAVEYVGSGMAGLGKLVERGVPDKAKLGLRVVEVPELEAGELKEGAYSVKNLENEGVDGVLKWILKGAGSDGTTVKTAVTAFIDDIFKEALEELSAERTATASTSSSSPHAPLESLAAAITAWSSSAYHALQSDLVASGFNSTAWHKIDWWKLLWRVDDVGNVARYVISEHFLRRSEKEAVFLAGRIFASHTLSTGAAVSPHDVPAIIAEEREDVIKKWIPALQAGAQAALMRSVEIAAAGGGFASLLAYSGVDVMMCGGVGVVGLVAALARMKRRWGKEKEEFEKSVKEKGRLAVFETEKWAWEKLKEVGKDSLVEKERVEVVGLVEEMVKAREIVNELGKEGSI